MKTKSFKTILGICFLLFGAIIFSCTKTEEKKRYDRLRAEVIGHYKSDPDPLKEKAAAFLLDNLKGRYSIEGERYGRYVDSINRYCHHPDSLHNSLLDLKKLPLGENFIGDIDQLTSGYLIRNIDNAFAVWENAPWKTQVDFGDFCAYILPYRIGHEPLEAWRDSVKTNILEGNIADSLKIASTIRQAATCLMRYQNLCVKNFLTKWGSDAASVPDLQYSYLSKLSTGTCKDLTHLALFVCRAAGIPAANDFAPNWGNIAGGHDWAAIITGEKCVPFILPLQRDTLGHFKSSDQILAKVYRKTSYANPESYAMKFGAINGLPTHFNDPNIEDVTGQYIPTSDVSIDLHPNIQKKERLFLSVSNRMEWAPITWGTFESGKGKFSKLGQNVVFLPFKLGAYGMEPVAYPFKIDSCSNIDVLKPDTATRQTIRLVRKYYMRSNPAWYLKTMSQGKFQLANTPDFSDAVTVAELNGLPVDYYNDILVNETRKYRYARFLHYGTYRWFLAELAFFGSNEETASSGVMIGSEGFVPFCELTDGDLLTFYEGTPGQNQWIGFDFGKPVGVSKISFAPRNDKNHVIPGNDYELFYWDNEWKSLGRQQAKEPVLVYENVPSACLFYLRNHTEGTEERPFTYENGKQVWW